MVFRLLKPHDFASEAVEIEAGIIRCAGAIQKINCGVSVPVRRIPVAFKRPFRAHGVTAHPVDVDVPGIGRRLQNGIVDRMLSLTFKRLLIDNLLVVFIIQR